MHCSIEVLRVGLNLYRRNKVDLGRTDHHELRVFAQTLSSALFLRYLPTTSYDASSMTSILARLRQPFRAINAVVPLPYVLNVIKLVAAVHLFTEHIGFLTRTEGPSMLPTLNVHGDWVYISRLYRRGKDIKVGDMVSIKHPMFPGFSAGKRVLGMPGDFVMFNGSGAGEDRMVQVSLGDLPSRL